MGHKGTWWISPISPTALGAHVSEPAPWPGAHDEGGGGEGDGQTKLSPFLRSHTHTRTPAHDHDQVYC